MTTSQTTAAGTVPAARRHPCPALTAEPALRAAHGPYGSLATAGTTRLTRVYAAL